MTLQEKSRLTKQANQGGDQGDQANGELDVQEVVQLEVQDTVEEEQGGEDETRTIGGTQEEDEHGYARPRGASPPPPPQTQLSDLPTAAEAHSTYIPCTIHIPKSCRGEYARALADTISESLDNPQDISKWTKLQIITKCVLRARGKGESQTAQSYAAEVRLRIQRWRNGEAGALWREGVKAQKAGRKGKKKKGRRVETDEERQDKENAIRATKLVQEGQFSRAAKALVSRGIDQNSAEAKSEMRRKHPAGNVTEIPEGDIPAPPIRISPTQVKKAIRSFKKGTAPGPDGMRPEHLKEALAAVSQNRSSRFQSVLSALVNFLASGGLPAEVAPYTGGANLFAGKKKDGTHRPIAVGNTIRRLVSKCIAYAVAGRAAALLRPYQFGVGVRGGCEGIIHAVRALLGDEDVPDGEKWLLQVDFENAFNLVDRSKMMAEVRKHLPDIAYWVESMYGVEAFLNMGDISILSSAGVHQGDPLASLLFSLALLPLVDLLAREMTELLEGRGRTFSKLSTSCSRRALREACTSLLLNPLSGVQVTRTQILSTEGSLR